MKRFLKKTALAVCAIIGLVLASVLVKVVFNHAMNNGNIIRESLPTVTTPTVRPHPATLLAGVAQHTITPTHPVYLGGFSPNRKSTGSHDDLYAKALVIQDIQGEKIVIVTLDLLGFLKQDADAVRYEIERRGITSWHNVIIMSTHQHSGPDPIGIWGHPWTLTSGRNMEYLERVAQNIIAAVEEANANLESAEFFTSHTESWDLCTNKRKAESIDPDVETLFCLRPDGTTIATIVNFSCHPEVLDRYQTLISADFPHYIYSTTEPIIGGITFFINGSLGGMVSPSMDSLKDKSHSFGSAEEIGTRLGYAVIQSYFWKRSLPVNTVSMEQREFEVPLENGEFRAAIYTGLIPSGNLHNGNVPTEVSILKIGNLTIATVPGEILPNLGLAIKDLLPQPRMLWSLANDEIGYILTEEDYFDDTYKYERGMSLGSKAGTLVFEHLKKLLRPA